MYIYKQKNIIKQLTIQQVTQELFYSILFFKTSKATNNKHVSTSVSDKLLIIIGEVG
jgi:hypothetical protein